MADTVNKSLNKASSSISVSIGQDVANRYTDTLD